MKIFHFADLHLNRGWFDWIRAETGEADLLAFAGDFQNAFLPVRAHAQAKSINNFLRALRTPYVAVTGNHDFWPAHGSADVYAQGGWLRMLRGRGAFLATDGETVDFRGHRLHCNGWLQCPTHSTVADILVTHAPPAGCDAAVGAEGIDVGGHGNLDRS